MKAKATRVPSDIWVRDVLVGKDENGNNVYETVRGESAEEVDRKVAEISRKRQYERQNVWQKENFERLSVVIKKGTKGRIKSLGVPVNRFVAEAVEKALQDRGV